VSTPRASRRLAALAALLALAAACRGDREEGAASAPSAEGGEPRQGGTAVVAELSDASFPHPLFFTGTPDSDLMDVMFMGLTRGAWRDGRLVALLADESPMAMARAWEYAGPDSASVRYHLKGGLRWSDGRPITAHDVVWTYRMYADTAVASPRQQNVEQLDSVVAENDSTVVFHFRRRYPEMIFDSGMYIVPRHAYEGTAPGALKTHPSMSRMEQMVVSGAFRVGQRQPGQQIVLVPNEHFSPRPRLDRIVIRIIPETTTRLVELRNGTVHFARNVPFEQIPGLRQQMPGVQMDAETGRFWEYVGYNGRQPRFADPRVRRALSLAVDVPAIARQLRMEEWVTPAPGPFPPILRDFHDPRTMRPLAQDTARARRLLDEAGWRDADGDGVREKGGEPFRFTLITNAGNQRRADVSQVLQQMWRAVGVDVRLQQFELGTVQERQFGDHQFDAVLGSWGVELTGSLATMFDAETPLNFVAYRNPETQRLIEQAEAQPTLRRAVPAWRAVAERIVQDQPYTWLYYYSPVTGRSGRLRGVHVDTFGAYQNVWEWWLADAPGPGAADSSTSKR
jgi:peptide/nickel transport system substrate-binding protein